MLSARLATALDLPRPWRRRLLDALGPEGRAALGGLWPFWAPASQLPPPADWRIWLVMAGRGFGKTRAGAEWVRAIAKADGEARIALVGATLHEARTVMVEGESGLLALTPPGEELLWEPSLRRLVWPSGARARLFSAAEPESLRGPQHSHAWCDEIGKWDARNGRAEEAWDNLLLGMRRGPLPQVTATTTPRATDLVRRLIAEADRDPAIVVTRGRTADNRAHLPPAFLAAVTRAYRGTRLGRQELDGELVEDVEGSLWPRALIEACRAPAMAPHEARAAMRRIVVAVDPPAGAKKDSDACGIVVAGLGADGRGHVLADASVAGARPEGWARVVAAQYALWRADRIVAEANQGGEMVRSVLGAAAGPTLPVRLVHARRSKSARAEPVSFLYETNRARHAGAFPALEDEMAGMTIDGCYEGPGKSPDRADALVWALTELMLGGAREPRVVRM